VAKLLPVSQVPYIAANVVFPIGIEDLDTPLATVFIRPLPAHVASQAIKLAVETGRGVWLEALECYPDLVAIDRSTTDRTAIVA
jgi:hypothetical protein